MAEEVAESPVEEVEAEAVAIAAAEEAADIAVEEVAASLAVAADLHAASLAFCSMLRALRGELLKGGLVLGDQEGAYDDI